MGFKEHGTVNSLPAEAKEFRSYPTNHLFPSYTQVNKKLGSLDIFAGCESLSQGLDDAGVAVELFKPAAKAFKLDASHSQQVYKGLCRTVRVDKIYIIYNYHISTNYNYIM